MIALLYSIRLSGQDVHFSQFYLSPLTLNPASTGDYNGDWRLASNYRTQWRSIDVPFNTFSLSYDRNFFARTKRFSAGLLILNDQSGTGKIVSNRIQLSGAIHPKIDRHNFHIGLQGGIALKSFDISGLTFPDQYDNLNGGFNNSLPNGELNYNQKRNYFDINFGVGWDHKLSPNARLSAGIALFHLTRPNESFFGSEFRVPVRKIYNIQARFDAGDHFYFTPRIFLMSQVRAAEYLLGSNIGYSFGPNLLNATSIYIGSQIRTGINRNTDAVMGIVGMTFERMEIGFNYDVNISSLQQATNRKGAMEIALIFWSGSNELKPKTIPCDRF